MTKRKRRKNPAAVALGRLGGSVRSPAQIAAAKRNANQRAKHSASAQAPSVSPFPINWATTSSSSSAENGLRRNADILSTAPSCVFASAPAIGAELIISTGIDRHLGQARIARTSSAPSTNGIM